MELFDVEGFSERGEIFVHGSGRRLVDRFARTIWPGLAEAVLRGAFISKLPDAEGEAAETQVWIEFAVKCGYLARAQLETL